VIWLTFFFILIVNNSYSFSRLTDIPSSFSVRVESSITWLIVDLAFITVVHAVVLLACSKFEFSYTCNNSLLSSLFRLFFNSISFSSFWIFCFIKANSCSMSWLSVRTLFPRFDTGAASFGSSLSSRACLRLAISYFFFIRNF